MCLLHFHHAKEVFKSSWHLLLHVWWNNLPNSGGEILPQSLRNVMSFILGVKWMNKLKLNPSYLLCMCVRLPTGWVNSSRQMPLAIPMVGGGMKRPLTWLLLLFNRNNRDHLQIQTRREISRFSICNEACPTQRRVALPYTTENLTFSSYNSDYDEDVDNNPIFEASCPSSEPHLLTPGDLNNHDLNFPD